jgi:hypothetical protein
MPRNLAGVCWVLSLWTRGPAHHEMSASMHMCVFTRRTAFGRRMQPGGVTARSLLPGLWLAQAALWCMQRVGQSVLAEAQAISLQRGGRCSARPLLSPGRARWPALTSVSADATPHQHQGNANACRCPPEDAPRVSSGGTCCCSCSGWQQAYPRPIHLQLAVCLEHPCPVNQRQIDELNWLVVGWRCSIRTRTQQAAAAGPAPRV